MCLTLIWVLVLAVSLAILSASAATAPSVPSDQPAEPVEEPEAPPPTDMLALTIVVYSTGEGPSRVGMTFDRQLEHAELENRIQRLGEKASWHIEKLRLRDEADPEDGRMLTLVSFECDEIVDWEKGSLGLKPLVKEFASETRFQVAFLVPGMENFSGPSGYSENGLQVRLIPGDEVYEYEVTPAQGQPEAADEEPSNSSPEEESGGIGLIVLLIIIASLASLGVVIGWLRCGKKKKNCQE